MTKFDRGLSQFFFTKYMFITYFVNEYYFFCREIAMRCCIQAVCRWDCGGLVAPTYKILGKGVFTKVQKILSLDIFIFVHF
jgi:hypothetical protein